MTVTGIQLKCILCSTICVFCLFPLGLPAAQDAPWGNGTASTMQLAPQRVVYDVAVHSPAALNQVLDRVSYLNNLYSADPFQAEIVLILHGNDIPFFVIENFEQHRALMERAQSLTVGGTIKMRMCQAAARLHGYAPEDIHGFVEMVPMADAEIVRLQREEGFAYMR